LYLDARGIQLAVAASGRSLLAYYGGVEKNGSDMTVRGAIGDTSAPFGQPSVLSAPGSYFSKVQAGIGDQGDGVVSWTRAVDHGWPLVIRTDYRPEGVPATSAGFGGVRDAPGLNDYTTVGPAGEAVRTWFDKDGYWAASAPPGGWFGPAELVKPPAREGPYVTFSHAGNSALDDGSFVLLFWDGSQLFEATRQPGGSYGEPVPVSGTPPEATRIAASVSREGTFAWYWDEDDDRFDDRENIGLRVVRRYAGEPVGDAEAITAPGVNTGYAAALGKNAYAAAIWSHSSSQKGTWASVFGDGPGGPDSEYVESDPLDVTWQPAERPVTRSRVGLRIGCVTACDVQVTGRLRSAGRAGYARLEPASMHLAAKGSRRVLLELSRAAQRRVREAAARRQKVTVRLTMRVTDYSGASHTIRRQYSARP